MNLNIKLSRRRTIQSISQLVNNGVSFTYKVLPDGTIKLYPSLGVSLSNVQFSISFNDASAIKTSSGGTLQNLEGNVEIENAEVYPT